MFLINMYVYVSVTVNIEGANHSQWQPSKVQCFGQVNGEPAK